MMRVSEFKEGQGNRRKEKEGEGRRRKGMRLTCLSNGSWLLPLVSKARQHNTVVVPSTASQ